MLPVGACALALAMSVLGFAFVPFDVSLALCAAGGIALALVALRRRPLDARTELRGIAWPAYVAVLVAAVAPSRCSGRG